MDNVQWICSYMGESNYNIWENGKRTTVAYKHSTSDYERKIYNGTDEDFTQNILGKLFTVSVCYGPTPITPKQVELFRDFLQQEHDGFLEWIKTNAADNPSFDALKSKNGPAEPLLYGGAYWDNKWVRI